MKSQAILIFDQEEAVRDSLQLVLSEEGFLCYPVMNEDDALKVLEKEAISLAILDNGVLGASDLLQKIKKADSEIKIIIISSYSEVDATQQALALGADDFILEPLDFDELLDQIKELLLPLAG